MGTCFVIQPFDKGKFDKRFDDHFAPAIHEAGLEPYRVDRDPAVRVPIDSIHAGITHADACLADITTNNPNVWYELGFALASQKETILVCSTERTDPFPFDIRHLNIIRYDSTSGRDFKKLECDIVDQLTARLKERQNLQSIASISPLVEMEGLSPHETAALAVLLANGVTPEDPVAPWSFKSDMEKAGFTPVAINLSIGALIQKEMAKIVDEQYDGEWTKMYQLERAGIEWLIRNQHKLILRRDKKSVRPIFSPDDDYDDSDPFADE